MRSFCNHWFIGTERTRIKSDFRTKSDKSIVRTNSCLKNARKNPKLLTFSVENDFFPIFLPSKCSKVLLLKGENFMKHFNFEGPLSVLGAENIANWYRKQCLNKPHFKTTLIENSKRLYCSFNGRK